MRVKIVIYWFIYLKKYNFKVKTSIKGSNFIIKNIQILKKLKKLQQIQLKTIKILQLNKNKKLKEEKDRFTLLFLLSHSLNDGIWVEKEEGIKVSMSLFFFLMKKQFFGYEWKCRCFCSVMVKMIGFYLINWL